eukprot:2932519-Rhodomonas_salina.3
MLLAAYAVSGTDRGKAATRFVRGYAATRCLVLTWAMLLPGAPSTRQGYAARSREDGVLCSYALPMRCPLPATVDLADVRCAMPLRAPDAMSGTGLAYGSAMRCPRYGTLSSRGPYELRQRYELRYAHTELQRDLRYWPTVACRPGTDMLYGYRCVRYCGYRPTRLLCAVRY